MPSSSSCDLQEQASVNVGEKTTPDEEDRHDDTLCTSTSSATRCIDRSACCLRIAGSRPETACFHRSAPAVGARSAGGGGWSQAGANHAAATSNLHRQITDREAESTERFQ